jgi:peptidoglycan hydrolase CwlO-like protein
MFRAGTRRCAMASGTRFAVITAFAAVLAVLPASTASGSSAPEDMQAQAARIQADIDAQAERIAEVDRHLRTAQDKAAAAEAALNQAKAKLADADGRAADAKRRLSGEAVDAYVSGNSTSFLQHFSDSDGSDLPVRSQYMKTATNTQREALDELRETREDLLIQRHQLQGAQRSAKDLAGALSVRRQDLAEVEGGQQANLRRVQGELGRHLAQEQARRNAEVVSRASSRVTAGARSDSTAAASSSGHNPPGGIWACIRQLESGNNYRIHGGGAYQIRDPTWHSLGQSGQAQDAEPATQDAMAIKLQQRSGWGQWPVTSKRCGAYD